MHHGRSVPAWRQEAENGEPIWKPTGFMSKCEDILKQLNRRCKGNKGQYSRREGGTHQLCSGKTARRAVIFQRELCEGVLIGLKNYMTRHRRMKNNEQFYTEGCGIMIDGDDDVRLHCRDDCVQRFCGTPIGPSMVQRKFIT